MGTLTWLDKSFLLKALKDAVDIEEFHVLPAVARGNNLLSDVCRALVHWDNGTRQSTSLFFKLPCYKFEILTFNEIEIYTSVLPKMYDFLKGNEICPNFYYCAKPENILVLEDLTESGFKMSRINTLIDFEHCAAGLKAIAKFHAASIAVKEKYPGLIEKVGSHGVGGKQDFLKLMVDISLRVMGEILNTCPGMQDYSKKLDTIRQDLLKGVVNLFAAEGPVNVLNHGDLTVNNMMFKYGENIEICDVRLFDFQLPSFASFGLDLQTFLISSVRADVLINRLDDLLQIYQTTFNSILSDCGSSFALSLEDVKLEFLKADCFGIFIASTLFCMRAVGAKKVADMSSFNMGTYVEKNDSPFRQILESEEYKRALPPVIRYFDKRGLFDMKK